MLILLWNSLDLTYPNWFWLLPAPLLLFWLSPSYRTTQLAIKVPFFQQLLAATGESPMSGASELKPQLWQRVILVISWCLVILALTKPVILGQPQTKQSIGRDIMVVVDLSGSMAEQDFTSTEGYKVSRLEATKTVLADFAKQREGDRMGLILFGDAAFVQTPFTADKQAWLSLLEQTRVAMAGQSTHLGDAIGLAIKVFINEKNKTLDVSAKDLVQNNVQQVAIILTDGNDTGSFVEPIEAAKIAKAKGVRLHIITIGDPNTVGESAIDMTVIEQIAEESGGEAFQALDRQQLQLAYKTIDDLEPQLYESITYYPKNSIHYQLILAVLLLYLGAFSLALLARKINQMEKRHD
ncbi:VWA domain-containing protein [Vibrio sp. FNV 38]|nr:VWA domain-containing protein [Vibrio sp. FNV 38]